MMATTGSTAIDAPVDRWTIREADGRDDAFSLVRLWHHYFGAEYDHDRLPAQLGEVAGWHNPDDPDESRTVCALIATHERGDHEVPIGGAVTSILDHEPMVEELPDGGYDAATLAGDRNAMFWFNCVDPAWRGRGIGHKLFAARLSWAEAQGASIAFAYGWNRRDGRSSRPLFEAYDWTPVQEFPDYYATSDRDSCPDCGVWPSDDQDCECGATLWAVDLPREGHDG